MFCTNCGHEIDDNAKFCKKCGTKVVIINPENIIAAEPVIYEDVQPEVTPDIQATTQPGESVEIAEHQIIEDSTKNQATEEVTEKATEKATEDTATEISPKKKSGIKAWMIILPIASGLCLLGAIAFLCVVMIGNSKDTVNSANNKGTYEDNIEDTDRDSSEDKDTSEEADTNTGKDADSDTANKEDESETENSDTTNQNTDDAAGNTDESDEEDSDAAVAEVLEEEQEETKEDLEPIYTEDELLELAELYYVVEEGGSASQNGRIVEIDSVDGNIYKIHIYKIMDDHTATYAWLDIDITSGQGTDLLGREVDLTQYEGMNLEEMQDNDYILPDSSSRKLSESELWDLSEEECKYARNEIYARNGRKFKNQELQDYFDSKSWYTDVYEQNEFKDTWLNEFENYNKDLIARYEKEKGYNQ